MVNTVAMLIPFLVIYLPLLGASVKDRFLVLITRQKALNRANFKNIRLVKD